MKQKKQKSTEIGKVDELLKVQSRLIHLEEEFNKLLEKEEKGIKDELETIIESSDEIVVDNHIKDKQKIENKTQINKKYLDAIIRECKEAAFLVDKTGILKETNAEMESVLGYKKEDFKDVPIKSISSWFDTVDDASKRTLTFTRLMSFFYDRDRANSALTETTFIDKKKNDIPFNAKATNLKDSNGQLTGVVFLLRDIRERKQVEDAIVKERQHFEKLLGSPKETEVIERLKKELEDTKSYIDSIIETSADGIFITDTTGYVKRVNNAFAELLDYQPHELIGKHTAELAPYEDKEYHTSYGDKIAGKIVSEVNMESAEAVISKEKTYVEFYLQRRDEIIVPVWCCSYLIPDKSGKTHDGVGIVRDLTEKKLDEIRLRSSEKRYRALFEYSPISLWEADLSEVKEYINTVHNRGITNFRKYFNERPQEVLGSTEMIKVLNVNKSTLELYQADTMEELSLNLKQLLGQKLHKTLLEVLTAIAEGRPFEFETTNRTVGGKEITVLIKSTVPPGHEKTWSRVFVSAQDLTERARLEFLKKTFGRYMTEEVMNMLIENPELVQLGGEKKEVTILMSDLRGFTPISERLSPEKIVQMLNNYFEVMVDVINNHHGTINEIKGDGMIVIFGAPQQMTDRAQRAVACSIEMQNAMDGANKQNRDQGLPELEMGIGLNDCEVIVGNVGSKKRRKYGMMGSGVNLTDRIESYTVGGQILISESVLKQAGKILRIDQQMEIHPKGVDEPLIVYDVGGIGGQYNVSLQYRHADFVRLTREIPIHYTVLEGKYAEKTHFEGAIIRLSRTSVEIRLQSSADLFANVKLSITDADGILSRQTFYGKVIKKSDTGQNIATVRFTGVPPEIDSYFQAAIAQAMAPS